MSERTLNHFALFSFTDAFWTLPGGERAGMAEYLLGCLKPAVTRADLYQIFPARSDADFLLWSCIRADEAGAPASFFRRLGQTFNSRRRYLRPVDALWGFTKPSQYARGQSTQEIDPLTRPDEPYLVVYPFVKTKEWYLMSRDARQGMMNEHMRTGHQYPAIKQLLLYSFGLQDQEFVVVYATEDLTQFSDLVNELRGAEGRRYTQRDTPTTTALYCGPDDILALWGAVTGETAK